MKIYQDNKEKIEDSLFIITVLISFSKPLIFRLKLTRFASHSEI